MNEATVGLVIDILGYLTLIGQGLLVLIIAVLFLGYSKKSFLHKYYLIVKENALTLIFIFASVATLGSLFLSEIAKFTPCMLCWWQRIFMYPISIISLIALIKNDKKSFVYILPISILGAGFALYHYLLQLFPNVLECSEETAKCSTIQFAQFGYITIPVMALTAFLLIAISSLYLIRK